MKSIHDLTTEEAYRLLAEHFGHSLPPLEAIEHEDWGRDYVLQHFQKHSAQELTAVGLSMEDLTAHNAEQNAEEEPKRDRNPC